MRLSAKQQGRLDGFFTVQPKDPKDVKKRKVRRLVLVFLDLSCRKLTKTLSPWAFRWTTRRIRKTRSQRLVLARRSEREREGGQGGGWMFAWVLFSPLPTCFSSTIEEGMRLFLIRLYV